MNNSTVAFQGANPQLIPVFAGQIATFDVQLCDARVLHRFLKVGRRFATWIAERIQEYGFVENQDFVPTSQKREIGYSQNGDKPKGGRPTIDFHLTLDMAKELAMVERNDQGKIARQYFIECERRLHKIAPNELTAAMQSVIAPNQKQILKAIVDRRVGEVLNRVPADRRKSLTGSMYQRTWRSLHTHFGVNEYSALTQEKFELAREYLEGVRIDWELLDAPKLPAPVKAVYSYPLADASPHDRQFGNACMTPKVLIDPKNRALELELIDQLEKDGHDVMGAKMRIIALRDAAENYVMLQARMQNWSNRIDSVREEISVYSSQRGKNVLFSRDPNPENALDRHVFADQFKQPI